MSSHEINNFSVVLNNLNLSNPIYFNLKNQKLEFSVTIGHPLKLTLLDGSVIVIRFRDGEIRFDLFKELIILLQKVLQN